MDIDSPNSQHLCPEPLQPHQNHLPGHPQVYLSLLAPFTSFPQHHSSLALLSTFYLSFHPRVLQVTDAPLLPWIVVVAMTARFKGWVKENNNKKKSQSTYYAL